MDYTKLKIFYEVALRKNITAASEMLHMSRQNVTKTIRSLEMDLGCKLFVRSVYGVELTHEGKIFLKYVNDIFDLTQALENNIKKTYQKNISYSVLCCNQIQPILQNNYVTFNEFFDANFNFFILDTNDINYNITEYCKSNKYDIILSCCSKNNEKKIRNQKGFTFQNLFQTDIGISVNQSHALGDTNNKLVDIEDLRSHHLVTMGNGIESIRPFYLSLLDNIDKPLQISRITNDISMFKESIISGKYFSFCDNFIFGQLFNSYNNIIYRPLSSENITIIYYALLKENVPFHVSNFFNKIFNK